MSANPKLLVRRALRRQFHAPAAVWPGRGPMAKDCHQCLCAAEVTLAVLEADGSLLSAPTEVRTEFGAWCHGEDRNGIRLDEDKFASREQAARWGDEQIGRYCITGYRIMRREHHVFAEGSRFATAITAWAEDKEERQ